MKVFVVDESKRGRNSFKKFKPIIDLLVLMIKFLPLKARIFMLNIHRNTKGLYGIAVRYVLLKAICIKCGENVTVKENVFFINPNMMAFGNNVSIHPMCYLGAVNDVEGRIEIGDDVSIAHGVSILPQNHMYEEMDKNIKDQPTLCDPVIIKNNVWIGAKATLLCGVTVEEGCVIGANSVVTKTTEMNKVYVGAPARVIKSRGDNS